MRYLFIITILLVAIVFFVGCKVSKSIQGIYLSRFAEGGYFSTILKLRTDSSVEYIRSGHFMFDSAGGNYKVAGNKLYMVLEREIVIDPLQRTYSDKLRYDTIDGEVIPYHRSYYYHSRRLRVIDPETGKMKKRSWGFLKTRKYVVFGPKYFRRKFFLKKIQ